MTHEQIHELIDASQDGELDVVTSRAVEQHLASCVGCRGMSRDVAAIRETVHRSQAAYRAPAHLRKQIRRALRAEDQSSPLASWLLVPAACALVLLGAWQLTQMRDVRRSSVSSEIVASHVRSLLAAHLVDVASSDQHTVKPWFDGKIDFAPSVKDLATNGFPLVGGRLDYLNGAPAAALVYQHNKHPINVFIQPARRQPDKSPRRTTVRGYNIIEWSRAGMNYWAVSDLNAAELDQLVRLVVQ